MDGGDGNALIAPDLLAQVYEHARAAFPLECCGYLTDTRIVRCTNVDASPTRFAIGGAELLAFARSFDGPEPARILYHSHTNGRAYVSATDRAEAGAYPVRHLVVGITATGVVEAALFDPDFVELGRWC
jgi:proteasome lid subunit RPN8/RPN11